MSKKRIVVAMSGGVDSSVVAAMLRDEQHEVIGITLQLYNTNSCSTKKKSCCAGVDIYDAKSAASHLGIPHYVLNYESKFKEQVIDEFVDSYLHGETPIPCIRCNQTVKFADLMKTARDLGADALATGHYVRKVTSASGPELHKATDDKKDQSYFLFTTTKNQLQMLEFPLGNFTKNKTRELADRYGLAVANKPDSQDICFVPNGNYKSVVEMLRPEAVNSGDIIDVDGNVVGQHPGIANFTVGQRRGLGITGGEPLYVVKIDPEKNSITIGPEKYLYKTDFFIKDMNFLADPASLNDKEVTARLRSGHAGVKARIELHTNGVCKIELREPSKLITPGQACVLYDDTRVLGGGWITRNDKIICT